MIWLKLDFSKRKSGPKGINTVVRSFQVDPADPTGNTLLKDDKGSTIEKSKREVTITDVEVPQYESPQDAIQAAGSEQQFMKKVNQWVKAEVVGAIRQVGNQFSADDKDDTIISKGREIARSLNPFKDRRKTGDVKERAARMDRIEEMVAAGTSDEDILAFIKANRAAA